MTGQANEVNTATTPTTTTATTIDGKYGVLRELSRQGNVTLSEVRAAEGVTRRVAWFDISTSADRQAFHAYRSVLRSLNPAGLTDVVARPGAYYAVWQPVGGTPLSAVLAQPVKNQETVEAVGAIAAQLAAHGYAVDDADIMLDGPEARIAYLRALTLPRVPEEVAARNARTLSALSAGRVRRSRQPGAWLAFIPGLLFLGGAVYLGGQAAQTYLNPPVREVLSVTGEEAREAAEKLTAAGFRVEYTEGQAGNQGIGTILRQDPAAGTNLPVGRLVTLTVNNPPSIEVPRVEEMTLDQARAALKGRAMVLGKVLKVDGTLTNTAEGRVVSQLPEAGSAAQRGQPVQVMVSTGVGGKESWLPTLTGLTVTQAREYARAAGLVVNKISELASDKAPGTVLDQTPAPYVRVAVGSPVTLTVAVARFSAPSRPAGDLPLPPPTAPQAPPLPPQPLPQDTLDQTTPEAQPEVQPAPSPAEIPATPPSGDPDARNVNFQYTFPGDLPAGTYTVVVRDANGEREILQATDASQLAGRSASSSQAVPVSGDAVFVVRRDGADYATVSPLTP
ncbi:PASTA domain-containing protein [Deinococcus aerophilus]|uniref:PASTA domain-containing protein n=1 Tax=Deinococcus aerophilus TaxID=522488 RepID=A0ABQ2GTN1_9DEIO|nr:PASTA domain-containing protein [Deinococcus aerophilus]GGM12883.1 PASTA domain-containing protein [Deinococcus aerophilus]